MFVIMKPLLVECVEAVLALNFWNYRMTLALMVGQPALVRAWKRQPGWLQCIAVSESMSRCSLQCFFLSLRLLSLFSASILRTLHWMVVCQEPLSWACSLQVPDRLHCFRLLATMSFHHLFYPPAKFLPPTGAQTRSCLGSQSLGILERWSRK